MPSGGAVPTPTVYRGKLYASGGFSSKEFYCFDAATGEFKWGVDLSDDGPSSAIPYGDSIIFGTESCTIFALNAESGALRWSWYLGDPLMSAPTVCGDYVLAAYPALPGEAGAIEPKPAKTSEGSPNAGAPAG